MITKGRTTGIPVAALPVPLACGLTLRDGGRQRLGPACAPQRRTMRNDFLLRAGRFLNRAGKPVLSIMRDDKTEEAMSEYLAALAT